MLKHLFIHLLRQQAAQHLSASKNLDWRLGARLLRDARVPLRAKAQSVALGMVALLVLNTLQLPLDALLIWLLPLVGFAVDFAWNGLELVAIPFFVATLALPFLAPREVVEAQKGGVYTDSQGRVYDAVAAKIR